MSDSNVYDLPSLAGADLDGDDRFHVIDRSDTTDSADGSDKEMTVTECIDGLRRLGLTQGREIPWHADASANFTLTNATLAARFAGNQTNRVIKLLPDMERFTQVRLVGNQVTTSASPNSPQLRMVYKTGAYSTVVGNYSNLAASGELAITCTGTGFRDTGWVDLPAGATGDCFVGLLEEGGDGVADPAYGYINLYLR